MTGVTDWLAEYMAYCAIDVTPAGVIAAVRGPVGHYGLRDLAPNSELTDYEILLFLHNMPLNQSVSLPLISLKNGHYIRCEIVPVNDELTTVHIIDAKSESHRQQQLQEKATALYEVLAQKEGLIRELNALRAVLEEQKKEIEQANRLKSNFISGMSHEFRSPLASVLGYADVIEEACEDKRIRKACSTIKRSAHHVMSLVDNILDASQFEQHHITLTLDNCPLSEIVDDVYAFFVPLAQEKKLRFSFNNGIAHGNLYQVDPVRLRQVMINLISNAIKFTQSGTVDVDVNVDKEQLVIRVRDSGGGVDADVATRLFQPFSRKRHDTTQGAGLGLSIVRYIAALMEGEVRYRQTSALGATGSEFTFIAPIALKGRTRNVVNIEHEEEDWAAILSGKSVVIVDDDEDVGALTAMLLNQAGAQTKIIDDGFAAIDYICAHEPNISIIDYNLPQCSGAQVIREIRTKGYSGRIIAISAAGKDVVDTMGADRSLQKPFSKRQLYQVVCSDE